MSNRGWLPQNNFPVCGEVGEGCREVGHPHLKNVYEGPPYVCSIYTFHLLFYMRLCLKAWTQTREIDNGLPSSQCLDPPDLSTGNSGGPWASVWPHWLANPDP